MKKKGIAFVLALLLGIWGVHRFYLGQRKLGILYLASFFIGFAIMIDAPYWDGPPPFLLTFVIGIIDAVLFLAMPKEDFDAKYNKGKSSLAFQGDTTTKARGRKYRKTTRQRQHTSKSGNPFKVSGLEKYKDYDYLGAIKDFKQSLDLKYDDPAVHFNLACCYSIMEETENAFFHIDKAVDFGFDDFDRIQNHDALAFLRTTDGFEQFATNGYRKTHQIEAPKEDLLSTPSPMLETDVLEKIASLGELRDKGFLTEDEFAMQKKRLLEMR